MAMLTRMDTPTIRREASRVRLWAWERKEAGRAAGDQSLEPRQPAAGEKLAVDPGSFISLSFDFSCLIDLGLFSFGGRRNRCGR